MTSDTHSDDFEVLHQGDWLRLVRHGKWEACERTHGGNGMAVLVIAVTPDDEVLFVEQYRVPLGARTIEMPAGLVGDGGSSDSLEDAARLFRQLTTIACDAPLGEVTHGFARRDGDADTLRALCDALRFGPLTRRRLYAAAGLDYAPVAEL